jgi:uncharacterized membrane protein YedE/YeeE
MMMITDSRFHDGVDNNPTTINGIADLEVDNLDTQETNDDARRPWWHNIKYLVVGVVFGIVFVKAEIISWFRIQEMFRLQSFHMYGVIGTAVVVGMISVWLIKKFNIKTIRGESITFNDKKFNKGQIYGGILFGLGWAMRGACPGPLFAQIGTGVTVVTIVLVSAIAGTWVYGYFREQLPH